MLEDYTKYEEMLSNNTEIWKFLC